MTNENVKLIPLTKGQFAIVDCEDYGFLSQWKWMCVNGYATRIDYCKNIFGVVVATKVWMHRLINNTPNNMITDHINGNRLDNRKENLRACNHLENARNCRKLDTNATSKYKGVYFCKTQKIWRASIRNNKKLLHLGCFDEERKAALAYNNAAIKYFGDFAKLNEVSL